MDDCDICCEPFNLENRRPKVLPCGHTVCLECLVVSARRGPRSCPTDRKVYDCQPSELPDNFYIISKESPSSSKRNISGFWCTNCNDIAKELCEKYHLLRNLKVVRQQEILANLNTLKREKQELRTVLARLAVVRDAITNAIDNCIEKRNKQDDDLSAIIRNAKRGLESDTKAWKKIKKAVDDEVAACVAHKDRYLEENRLLTISSGSLDLQLQGYPFSWKGSVEIKGEASPDVLRTLLFLVSDSGLLHREVSLPKPPTAPQPVRPTPSEIYIKKEVVSNESPGQQYPGQQGQKQLPSSDPGVSMVRVRPIIELQDLRFSQQQTPEQLRLQERPSQHSIGAPAQVTPCMKRGPAFDCDQQRHKKTKMSPCDQRKSQLEMTKQRLEELNRSAQTPQQTRGANVPIKPEIDRDINSIRHFVFDEENILNVHELSESGPNYERTSKEIMLCSKRKIKQLFGLNCGSDPAWSLSLLRAQRPHLEDLQVYRAGADHLDVIADMPRLRRLQVRDSTPHLADLNKVLPPSSSRRSTLQVAHLELPSNRVLSTVWAHGSTLRELTLHVSWGAICDSAVALWPFHFYRLDERLADCRLTALEELYLQRFPTTCSGRVAKTNKCAMACLRQLTVLRRALPGVKVQCLQCRGTA